ncbi:hypothetical protein Pan161_31800 [Gimesia algae]|uniref:Uncharacterized protein n=1 Tax=Gimesia algae TaxID=2527971 RepID=A0A517VET5_9PLAN|nr:hypothetical protein Pan161_31800 [Gimesia algae]
MSSFVVTTRTVLKQESIRNSLVQIIYRALATSGFSQIRRIKVRVHESMMTLSTPVSQNYLTQTAQNIAIYYQGTEILHNDVEVVAMDFLPG